MRNILVTAGYGGYGRPYMEALSSKNLTHMVVNDPREVADIPWPNVFAVVFSGGADIDPGFYNAEAEAGTWCDEGHDALDHAMIDQLKAYELRHPNARIYKYGTCRGAQLLFCTHLGGKLVQHIDHHEGDHIGIVLPYELTVTPDDDEGGFDWDDPITGPARMNINSIHHQAMRWETVKTNCYDADDGDSDDYWDDEYVNPFPQLLMVGESEGQTCVEAFVSKKDNVLGFQYHPEWLDSDSDAAAWSADAIRWFAGVPTKHNWSFPNTNRGDNW